MNARDLLKYGLEIVATLLAAFHGFILRISPPEEIRSWQSAVSGVASFLLLIIFLFIVYLTHKYRTSAKYALWMIIAAVGCAASGVGTFFKYQAETNRLTFVFPPPPPSIHTGLHVKGEVLTDDAAKWKSQHQGITDAELVDSFGGLAYTDRVWTHDSIGKVKTVLTGYYVLFVVTLLSSVLCLAEGLITSIRSDKKKASNQSA